MSKIFQRPTRVADPAHPDGFRRPLILGGVLLVIWLVVSLMPEQSADGPPPTDPVSTAANPITPAAGSRVTQSSSDTSLIRPGYIVAMLLLGAGGFWAWRLRKGASHGGSDSLLRELGRLRTGPNQEVMLVACGPDVLLLGATSQQVTLLRQYPAETLIPQNAPEEAEAEPIATKDQPPVTSEFMHVLRRYNDPRNFRSSALYPRQTAESSS